MNRLDIAEKSIIGSLLMDHYMVEELDFLKSDMFTSKFLGQVFEECRKCFVLRKTFDIAMLSSMYEQFGMTEDLVVEILKNCLTETYVSSNVKHYGYIIFEKYKASKARGLLSRRVFDTNIDEQIGLLVKELDDLLDNKESNMKSMKQLIEENKSKCFTEREIEITNFGIPSLEENVMLEKGDLLYIAARPSVGKSAFSTQVAINLALAGKKVAIFNLEMNDEQMYHRFISNIGKLSVKRLRLAKCFLGEEESVFSSANDVLEKLPIFLFSGSSNSANIRKNVKAIKPDYFVVDYLQNVTPDDRYKGNKVQEVGQTSLDMKRIAVDLQTRGIVLSQFKRGNLENPNVAPTLSDLRESGNLEQDASIVILMSNHQGDKDTKLIDVAKNRQGELVTCYMKFDGAHMKFIEVDKPKEDISNDGFKKARKDWDRLK